LPDGKTQTASVDRTVGSRRIEQYLTKQQGQYTRLPLAYDLVNKRWMSLNGSFFHPDSDNYFSHTAQWDGNCVFCHNVKAQPHIDFKTKQYQTEVSELGIACGACHGAGAEHAQAALSPLTRTMWRLQPATAKQIVNPAKLTAERSLMVCGHCHGQRVPEPFDRIQTILTAGDPYNAGDDLANFYRPVSKDTSIGNVSFANRFWDNGSPRLTAYEYQGVLRSKCFTKGDPANRINCLTCHSMHDGDPAGQITDENRTDKPCLSCHARYAEATALANHTKHKVESSGSRCYNCHMPRVVYGVMSFHPTHDITVPDPSLTVTKNVPNACNQCHLDRSANWAIAEAKRLWPSRFSTLQAATDEQFNSPEGPRMLFAGDALTRALAADLLAGNGPHKPEVLWAGPLLVEALADDYPIVRFFAANGLTSGGGPWRSTTPDYLSSSSARDVALKQWRELMALSNGSHLQEAQRLMQTLTPRRRNVDLEVGE
jgi:predicted CXXCH cytochrome family protein